MLWKNGKRVILQFISAFLAGCFLFEGFVNRQTFDLPQILLCAGLFVLAAAAYRLAKCQPSAENLRRGGRTFVNLSTILAASAACVYFAWAGGDATGLLSGALLVGLAYFLSTSAERRVEALRNVAADELRGVRATADLHLSTIESLAIAIGAKDQTTHGHVRRKRVYAVGLGEALGVSASELEALRAGALLHDIGKLAVPEYILNKPGRLTSAEFEKMKIHAAVGGDILRRVNFPFPVEDVVRYHHEKWDGTGYPEGLKGEQIPLVARIISVVDFYDTMRCDRPYREGLNRADALSLLLSMKSSSFDPAVVETFVEHVDNLDKLIAEQDLREQVSSGTQESAKGKTLTAALTPSAQPSHSDQASGFRSIAEAQREVFALHEIAQTIGSSLNLRDTVALVSSKLRAIVPFDTCVIFFVDETSGKARAAHAAGEHAEFFSQRSVAVGEGITGWVIANARSMSDASPELDLQGVPEEVASQIGGVLSSPLVREDGAFGAITLYSSRRTPYTLENVRRLESVALYASSALNNALIFERTKERALTDPLTELPNARAIHLLLEQRLAECQRMNRDPVVLLCMNVDDFKEVNDVYGHGVGDRVLASVAGLIKKQLRQMDVLARYSGDEFVAVMPTASAEVAALVAERIRAAVESHDFPVRTGRTVRLGLSIGIGCFPADGETSDDLLHAAARHMRRDKHTRKLSHTPSPSDTVVPLDAFR